MNNICVLGPARSRTSLLGDVCRQANPTHAFFYEPGLVPNRKQLLEYFQAKNWSRGQIAALKARLELGTPTVFKIVAGATYFDLTEDDLSCFASHCKIVLATRRFPDAAVSYLAAMKTRFFNADDTEFSGTIAYEPMFDDAKLFWYTGYYIQFLKWWRFLEKIGANIQIVNYSDATDYEAAARLLGFSGIHFEQKVKPPHSKSYSDLFTNYSELLYAVSRFERSIPLL